jgi:hypothetical protein
MGKVRCFSIPGFECVFYPGDHLPHHFHVIKEGKWNIRVKFLLTTEAANLNFEFKWKKDKKGPSSKELHQIGEKVILHKAAILKEWEAKAKQG